MMKRPMYKNSKPKIEKTFPDMSGDGKVTKKDILIAKGVIKKPMKKKKIMRNYYNKGGPTLAGKQNKLPPALKKKILAAKKKKMNENS